MKKILCIALAVMMVFGLAACGNDSSENSPLYSKGLNKDGFYDIKALDFISLPALEGVEFGDEFWTADEDEVQSQIESLKSSFATTNQVTNKAVAFGDNVNIDYSGSVDGEKFEGGTATNQTVVAGGTNFIDDFLTQIIGHFPGETFDIEVTFPDPYSNSEALSGKDAVFEITINYIAEKEYPEIDDAFVKENLFGKFGTSTVAELEDYVRESIIASNQADMVTEYLVDNSIVASVPEIVVEHQKNCVRQNYEDSAASYGVDVDTLVSYYGAESLEALLEDSEEDLIKMSGNAMIFQAAAEKLNISVKNVDVADYFENMTNVRDYASYQDHYGLGYLKMVVMVDKVTQYVVKNAVKAN